MKPWEFYLDESYNDDRTLCIGGFLAPRDMWDVIIGPMAGTPELRESTVNKEGFS